MGRRLVTALIGVVLGLLLPHSLSAREFKPVAVSSQPSRLDKAYNESIARGIARFQTETGITVAEATAPDYGAAEAVLNKLAAQGHDPILVTGFAFAPAVQAAARQNPNTRFILLDAAVTAPNVQSVLFKEHEGSFLVGILAAMKSKSGVIGFIGGMDSPTINRFRCGYLQGAKAIKPSIAVIEDMVGTTVSAWTDPEKARALANAQLARGADVIYAAAGGSGVGALEAAAEQGRFGIGVDSNQNGLFPGRVLTSMLKRVDIAVYSSLKAAAQGRWSPSVTVLGLAEDGVGWSQDQNNALIISDDMFNTVEAARQAIISGNVRVHDFAADMTCPIRPGIIAWPTGTTSR